MVRARSGPSFTRGLLVAVAVAAVVLGACGKDSYSGPSSGPDCRRALCTTAIPCRKNDCKGELFWNGCCACPPNTVNGFTCDGGGP